MLKKIFSFFTVRKSAKNSQGNIPMNGSILEQPVADEVVRKSFRGSVLSRWLKFEFIIVMEKVKIRRPARSP
ncbi:hypothetical protein [Bartonella sp. AU55XJBT]|uniref:hypothetical protein n=1 Tax=Bartonella sp. AU55XJBT TaxID=3019091 RepID=UPI0023616805|nr:hypothetical protein [Bartonella sp. AU55XJBT]